MSCLSCICKLHLLILSFLIFMMYFIVNNLIFMEIYYYEREIKSYALKPQYIDFSRAMFYIIPIVMFIFIVC